MKSWLGDLTAGFVGATVITLMGATVALAAPAVVDLAPHQAIYAMHLSSTKFGSGVTNASGNMSYKFSDSCDGWTVENKTVLSFSYSDGEPVATTWDFVTWESKDGLHYRFRVRSTRDGVVNEEIAGTAQLEGHGKGGVAKYNLPEPKIMRLPKGTIFPTDHTRHVLETAQKGERILHRTLFDGTGTDGTFNVNALIGRTLSINTPSAGFASNNTAINKSLLSVPSWPTQMAFYPAGDTNSMPDYEVTVRYFANGVVDDVLQSFGTFSLKGTLERLEILPKPDC